MMPNVSGIVSHLSGVLMGDVVGLKINAPTVPSSIARRYAAGTYLWSGSALTGDTSNYVLKTTGNIDKTLIILRKPLQVAASAVGGQYYGFAVYGSTAGIAINNAAPGGVVTYGLSLQDNVSVSGYFSTPQGNVQQLPGRLGAGTYPIITTGLIGNDAANYLPSYFNSNNFQVTPKTVTIQLPNATLATYGPQITVTPSASGVLSGDSLAAILSVCNTNSEVCNSGNGTIAARTAAGTYRIQATGLEGASAANYRLYAPQDGRNFPNAFLRINPKLLNVTADPASLSTTYGDRIAPLVVTGMEAGDIVQVIPKALRITAFQNSSDIKFVSDTLLDAGSYDYFGVTSGRDRGNYQTPASFGTITVAKRPLLAILPDRSTTYGTFLQAQPILSNVVAGQTVSGIVSTFDGTGQAVTYSERTSAGHFTNRVTALAGATAANYVIDSASADGKLDILQKTLNWELVVAPAAVYGSAAKLGTLRGVEFGDDVGINTSAGGAIGQVRLNTDNSGGQYYGAPLDVGNYIFSTPAGALVGAKSGNYILPAGAAPSMLTVTPKALTYLVGDGGRTYGNYDASGYWIAPRPLNQFSYFIYGNVATDKFSNDNFALGLLDAKGAVVNMDSTTPVGNYQFVLAGLSGPLAKNYTIATTGNTAGHFTVSPMVLTYSTTSGIFLQGTGLVGTPGLATLRGPNGTPINGDQVQGVVSSNVDPANLHAGRYHYAVTSLIGKDAGNYRLLNSLDYKQSDWRGVGDYLTWVGGNPYRKDDAGTLDVFLSNRFGQAFSNEQVIPVPGPALPTVTYKSWGGFSFNTSAFNTDAISVAQPSGQLNASGSTAPAVVAGSGSSAAAASSTSVTASVGASTGAQTSTELGDAKLTAGADASSDASATAGPTGAKAEANAGVKTGATVSIGSGTVSAGAEANVSTEASLGRDGAKLTAKSTADVKVQGGGSGSAGPVGDISGSGTVAATAGAEATGTATIKDGKVSTGVETTAGAGASASAKTGVAGSVGSADANATVYSPGSFGGRAGVTGGYADGKISVGLNLGAQLGIGGLNLNINFSIDTGAILKGMAAAGGWISDVIGYGPSGNDIPPMADQFWNDPVGHYAFLKETDPKRWYVNTFNQGNLYSHQNFLYKFDYMVRTLDMIVSREASRQSRLIELLRIDPKAAVEFAHATDLNGSSMAGYNDLMRQANDLGVKLSMTDNKLGFVKK